jgi:hypothetical protein
MHVHKYTYTHTHTLTPANSGRQKHAHTLIFLYVCVLFFVSVFTLHENTHVHSKMPLYVQMGRRHDAVMHVCEGVDVRMILGDMVLFVQKFLERTVRDRVLRGVKIGTQRKESNKDEID